MCNLRVGSAFKALGILLFSSVVLYAEDPPSTPTEPASPSTNAPPAEVIWTLPPGPTNSSTSGPFSEEQIRRTLERIAFIENGAVVRLGLKHLNQIIEKQDLSSRDDLKAALLHTMSADGETYKNLGYDVRIATGTALGHSKALERSSDEVIALLKGKEPEPARVSLVEYSLTTKKAPPSLLVAALKELKLQSTLIEIALASADKEIISYLVQIAKEQNNYDSLYGLDALDAATEVVTHFKKQLEVPPAPTDLTATLTTYHSVQLSWKDNSQNESGFVVLRSVGSNPLKEVARLPSNQIYYADDRLEPGFTYNYQVNAAYWGTQPSETAVVSVTTPALPDPLPDPLPVVPPLPSSPPASEGLGQLAKKMRIEIEGKAHQGIIEGLIALLRNGPTPVDIALMVGKSLEAQFTKVLFDQTSLSTSLGLKCIEALKFRGDYESLNMNFPENIRRANAAALRSNANFLDKIFNADLVIPPAPTPPPTTNAPTALRLLMRRTPLSLLDSLQSKH